MTLHSLLALETKGLVKPPQQQRLQIGSGVTNPMSAGVLLFSGSSPQKMGCLDIGSGKRRCKIRLWLFRTGRRERAARGARTKVRLCTGEVSVLANPSRRNAVKSARKCELNCHCFPFRASGKRTGPQAFAFILQSKVKGGKSAAQADIKLMILLPLSLQHALPVCTATTRCLILKSGRLKEWRPETGLSVTQASAG